MKNSDYTDNNVEAGLVPAFYIHIPFCRKKCGYCDFVSADYADKTTDYTDRYLGFTEKCKSSLKYGRKNDIIGH